MKPDVTRRLILTETVNWYAKQIDETAMNTLSSNRAKHRLAYHLLSLVAPLLNAGSIAQSKSFLPIEMSQPPFNIYNGVACAYDISPDGSRIGGVIVQPGTVDSEPFPFTWSRQSGLEVRRYNSIPAFYKTPYGAFSWLGANVVGVTQQITLANSISNDPILFDEYGYRVIRPDGAAIPRLQAAGLSSDGSVVVGTFNNLQPDRWRPFRWTEADGFMVLNDSRYSKVTGVSGDGRIVIGTFGEYGYTLGNQAFRWSADDGVTYIDSFKAGLGNLPSAISHDGSVVVGHSQIDRRFRAYRWTSTEGTKPIDLLEGYDESIASDVSGDGSIVIGQLKTPSGPDTIFSSALEPKIYSQLTSRAITRAMIWDCRHGTRLLQDVLTTDYGLADELTGWTLVSASAMSANGNVISGVGINPAGKYLGWVVIIPEPNSALLLIGNAMFLYCLLRRQRRVPLAWPNSVRDFGTVIGYWRWFLGCWLLGSEGACDSVTG